MIEQAIHSKHLVEQLLECHLSRTLGGVSQRFGVDAIEASWDRSSKTCPFSSLR